MTTTRSALTSDSDHSDPDEVAIPPWERLADVVLQREAALSRIVAGVLPRDFAGLFIGHDEVDALLRTLPGLDGPMPAQAADVRDAFAEPLAAARAAFEEWLGSSRDVLARCARAAGATTQDAEVLALVCAVEDHPQRQRLVAYVQDNVQLPRPTLATLRRVFGPGHRAERAVAPAAPLRRAALMTVEDAGPWSSRMCGIPARLLWALHADASPDPDLPPDARLVPGTRHDRPAADGKPESVHGSPGPASPRLLLVHGADPASRRRAVALRYPGRDLLVTGVPAAPAAWQAVVREAVVAQAAVVLEVGEPLPADAVRRLEDAACVPWAVSSPSELPLDALPWRGWTEVDVADGTADDGDWEAGFGTRPPAAPALDREQLRLVAAACAGDPERLPAGLRRLAGGRLDRLAVRVRPQRGWSDLVLPADQLRQLHELAARRRRREVVFGDWGFPAVPSRGVVALFAGPSGTGKTLAAEVVAADLGLDLYKVDLSAVVSKWIGETEKNLARIFEAADAGELVLFFDEADALFGKRSEVTDARDRYANIEVAYLLQRLETYDGLVVMATNLQRNIDQAFLRRISVAVDFTLPEEDQRRAIWAYAFPRTAPTADLDLDFLARQFKVTGGVIANAARTAAFLAADDGAVITMEHVALSMKREFQKLGRMRTEAEFAAYYDVVSRDS